MGMFSESNYFARIKSVQSGKLLNFSYPMQLAYKVNGRHSKHKTHRYEELLQPPLEKQIEKSINPSDHPN